MAMKRLLRVILGCNAISLIHLFRPGTGTFSHACARAFGAAQNLQLHEIPQITLDEILGERRALIRLCVMRYEDGMLGAREAMALLSILVAEHPNEVLEIGTYMGHTTKQMAENLDAAIIHTVDLPEVFPVESNSGKNLPKDDFHLIKRRRVGREFKGHSCAQRIREHFADTATWNFREAGCPTFFFIDGSHTYEYCKSDSEKCFALCDGRGVFLWHDCDHDHPGVVRFVSEWRRMGRDIRRIWGTSIAYWKSPNETRPLMADGRLKREGQ